MFFGILFFIRPFVTPSDKFDFSRIVRVIIPSAQVVLPLRKIKVHIGILFIFFPEIIPRFGCVSHSADKTPTITSDFIILELSN